MKARAVDSPIPLVPPTIYIHIHISISKGASREGGERGVYQIQLLTPDRRDGLYGSCCPGR